MVLADLDELATASRLSRPVSSRLVLVPALQGTRNSYPAQMCHFNALAVVFLRAGAEEKVDVGATVPGPTVSSPVDVSKIKSASSGPRNDSPAISSRAAQSTVDGGRAQPKLANTVSDLPLKSEPVHLPAALDNLPTVSTTTAATLVENSCWFMNDDVRLPLESPNCQIRPSPHQFSRLGRLVYQMAPCCTN